MNIYYESSLGDDARRDRIYAGDVCIYAPRSAASKLCELAKSLITEAFRGIDPLHVHEVLPVEECIRVLSTLKPQFIHHPNAKTYIPELLLELGCDPEKTFFDVPRLRTAFPGEYLTAGIAYAFHPHRDTWYSAPMCQINWWMPIYEITPHNAMAFHPQYFSRPVRNGSSQYNYQEWNQSSRFSASKHVKVDTRVQPKPEEPLVLDPDVRVLVPAGGTMLFSAAQLHSTVPNTSGVTRYSIDFRTVQLDDVKNRKGAVNVDAACTGTTMCDYLRARDLSHLPDDVFAMYEAGTPISTT
jgi:hypothetical protein